MFTILFQVIFFLFDVVKLLILVLNGLLQLQLVRSNSNRFTPSQADEQAHQLSYLQKHLACGGGK
jgi:hypothetical protein